MSNMEEPGSPSSVKKFAFGCAMLASMTSTLLGYDIGVMSGAAIFIQEDFNASDVQIEILMGIINVYSLIGSFAAGRTSDWIGRRYTIVLAAGIFFAGAFLMGFAPNYTFLMVGRFVAGIGIGYALMIAPVYTAEVSPSSQRGFLTSFPEVFINTGILLGYISNYVFSHFFSVHLGWRLMLGIGAVPSVFLAIGVLYMPESPRWLVLQGRLGEARKVLYRTSESVEEAELRLEDIKKAAGIPENCTDEVVTLSKKTHGEGVWKELFVNPTPSVRRIVIAGVFIHIFQQASGIDAVVLYSPRVFESAGIYDESKLLLATIAVGTAKTIFILASTFLLDRVGRRPLLLTSVGGMITSLLGIGIGLKLGNHHPGIILSIISTLTFVSTFSIGLGPITWVYSSEIFPLRLRAQGVSIAVALNRLTSGLITMTFLSLSKAITIAGSFFFFSGIATISFVFFYTFLPETRGADLENVERLFGKVDDDDQANDNCAAQQIQMTTWVGH